MTIPGAHVRLQIVLVSNKKNLKIHEALGKVPGSVLLNLWCKISPRINSILVKSDEAQKQS